MNETLSNRRLANTKKWYLVDAKDQTLGRIATKIATILIGKHKTMYDPSIFSGDNVIVINAKQIHIGGGKEKTKVYKRHSGRPGGLSVIGFSTLKDKTPNRIIESAVKGMLPKNKLGRKAFGNLKVYPDAQHPHLAQKPEQM